jgi:hypothetical protein
MAVLVKHDAPLKRFNRLAAADKIPAENILSADPGQQAVIGSDGQVLVKGLVRQAAYPNGYSMENIWIRELKKDSAMVVGRLVDVDGSGYHDHELQLPMANDSLAGLMSGSDHEALTNALITIQGLQGKSSRLNAAAFSFDVFVNDPTTFAAQQQEINDYALAQLGLGSIADLPNFVGVHNLNGNHLFIFNQDSVSPVWIDNGFDTVAVATNLSLGVVLGSLIDGNVRVNADGTMSVNGVNSKVPNTRIINTASPLTGGGELSSDLTLNVSDATTVTRGVVRLTTGAELADGTGTATVISPSDLYTVVKEYLGDAFEDGVVPQTRTVATSAPLTGGGALSSDLTLNVSDASDTARGVVRLATAAETAAGSSTDVAVTPKDVKTIAENVIGAETELFWPVHFNKDISADPNRASIPAGYNFCQIVGSATNGTGTTLVMSSTYGSGSVTLSTAKVNISAYAGTGKGVSFDCTISGTGKMADFMLRLTKL